MSRAIPNFTTAGTSLGGVPRINVSNRNTFFKSFVFNKELELTKGPRVVNMPLLFPDFSGFPDPLEILHYDKFSFFDRVNYFSTDDVVNIAHPSSFLAREPYQGAFSTLCAFSLEGRAKSLVMLPCMLSLFTGKTKSIGTGCNVINAKVYANWLSAKRCHNFFIQSKIDIKNFLGFLVNKVCHFGVLLFQKTSLIITDRKLKLQSSFYCGEGNHFPSFYKSKGSIVKVKGKSFKGFWSSFSLLGNSGDSSNNKVSLEIIPFLYQMVGKVVKLILIKCLFLSCYFQNIIASTFKAINSLKKYILFFQSDLKLTLNRFYQFHICYYITKKEDVKEQFLRQLKQAVSLR